MKIKEIHDILSADLVTSTAPLVNNCLGITHDSRKIKSHWCFIAIKGSTSDGHSYIKQAIKQGACSILLSSESLFTALKNQYPTIDFLLYRATNSYKILAKLAESFYDFPAKKLKLIGVTGTNGKTTTSSIICDLVRASGEKCALIGTNAYDLDHEIFEATHTTPDPIQLQALLARCLEKKITTVVMEVSSHSAHQGRIGQTKFESLIFTNLTGEHLDYHQNMENYFHAKKILFETALAPQGLAIINIDDDWGKRLYKQFETHQAYGFCHNIHQFTPMSTGTMFTVNQNLIETPLFGKFNAANATAAFLAAKHHGISEQLILQRLKHFPGVAGRMQAVKLYSGALAFVDYAHTDDALLNIGQALQELPHERIITVFGCGGDRDRTKRPRMAAAAEKISDQVIVTADNSRNENIYQIMEDIKAGFSNPEAPLFIVDRLQAIEKAVAISKKGDIILVAGKGHENYQIQNNKKIHFCDFETLNSLNKQRKS
jgi:UDP-N-acetylmuramoyl-L-alanyl-D-glutamate--2,6-diaminopimelate ligase